MGKLPFLRIHWIRNWIRKNGNMDADYCGVCRIGVLISDAFGISCYRDVDGLKERKRSKKRKARDLITLTWSKQEDDTTITTICLKKLLLAMFSHEFAYKGEFLYRRLNSIIIWPVRRVVEEKILLKNLASPFSMISIRNKAQVWYLLFLNKAPALLFKNVHGGKADTCK